MVSSAVPRPPAHLRAVDPAKARVLAICLAGVGGTLALVRGVAGTLG